MPDEFPDFSPEEYFITREENKDHIMYEDEKKEKEKGKREEEKGNSEEEKGKREEEKGNSE